MYQQNNITAVKIWQLTGFSANPESTMHNILFSHNPPLIESGHIFCFIWRKRWLSWTPMFWFNFVLAWFKFYFPLFWGMVIYDNEFETKENYWVLTGGSLKSSAWINLWMAPVTPLPTNITESLSLAFTAFLMISLQIIKSDNKKCFMIHTYSGLIISETFLHWGNTAWLIMWYDTRHVCESDYYQYFCNPQG